MDSAARRNLYHVQQGCHEVFAFVSGSRHSFDFLLYLCQLEDGPKRRDELQLQLQGVISEQSAVDLEEHYL